MVFQNYQNLIEITSNIIDIVVFGVGFKCPRKIHLNTQCPPSLVEIGLRWLPKLGKDQSFGCRGGPAISTLSL